VPSLRMTMKYGFAWSLTVKGLPFDYGRRAELDSSQLHDEHR
jgi:hypothetical protein